MAWWSSSVFEDFTVKTLRCSASGWPANMYDGGGHTSTPPRQWTGTLGSLPTVQRMWTDHPDLGDVVVPVNVDNVASWRALEKAGFHKVAIGNLEPDNPIDRPLHHILRIERPIGNSETATELDIRAATAADCDQVADLHLRVWQQTYAHLVPAAAYEALDLHHRRAQWEANLKHDQSYLTLLAIAAGELVGFVYGGPLPIPK